MAIHVFYLYKPSSFNRHDHLVDGFLRPLDLHGDTAVPFVPGSAVQLCGMAGTIAEADALNQAMEGDVFANPIHHLTSLVSLCPGQQNIRKLQFIDILKVVQDTVLLQLLQEGVHEYGVGKRL